MLSRNAPNLLLGWGTVSWLQVTHPFPNEPPTLNTWQGGSSASDFSCPPHHAWPCFKASPAPSRAQTQIPKQFHLWAAASLPTEEQRPGLGFQQERCPDGTGRTNRLLLLRRRVRCSWYLAQAGSGVPRKQTPPSTNPRERAPGTSLASLQIALMNSLLQRKNPSLLSPWVLVCAVSRGQGGFCPQSPLPHSCSRGKQLSPAQPQSSRKDGHKAATVSTETEK